MVFALLGFAVTACERQCGVRQVQKGPSQLWEALDPLAVGLCCCPQGRKLAGALNTPSSAGLDLAFGCVNLQK